HVALPISSCIRCGRTGSISSRPATITEPAWKQSQPGARLLRPSSWVVATPAGHGSCASSRQAVLTAFPAVVWRYLQQKGSPAMAIHLRLWRPLLVRLVTLLAIVTSLLTMLPGAAVWAADDDTVVEQDADQS